MFLQIGSFKSVFLQQVDILFFETKPTIGPKCPKYVLCSKINMGQPRDSPEVWQRRVTSDGATEQRTWTSLTFEGATELIWSAHARPKP